MRCSWRWAGAATPAWCAKARPRPTSRADFALTRSGQQPGCAERIRGSEEGGALLRRVIDNAGRSKAYINGIAATATQLRELGELLVDIHGQHAHQSLLKGDAQRALLDNQIAVRDPAPHRAQVRRSPQPTRPGARWRASARNSRPMPRTCCSSASASNGR
jgi:DNA repair protein RecN (Recombination protein N)